MKRQTLIEMLRAAPNLTLTTHSLADLLSGNGWRGMEFFREGVAMGKVRSVDGNFEASVLNYPERFLFGSEADARKHVEEWSRRHGWHSLEYWHQGIFIGRLDANDLKFLAVPANGETRYYDNLAHARAYLESMA